MGPVRHTDVEQLTLGDNTAHIASVRRENIRRKTVPVECESDLVLGSISRTFIADDYYERLVSSVRVNYPRIKTKAARKGPAAIKKITATRGILP